MDIITNPTPEQWNLILHNASNPQFNQTWEWGEFYGLMSGIHPIRLLALQDEKPIALLQAFEWKWGPLSLGIVSGDSGGGGGPICISGLEKEIAAECYRALITRLFSLFQEKRSLRFLLYTIPGDQYPMPDIPAKVSEKCTPILRLPESEEAFLKSLGKQGRQELETGKKRGLILSRGTRDDLREYTEVQNAVVREKGLPKKHVNTLRDWERLWDIFSKSPWGIRFFIGKKDGKMVGAIITLEIGNAFFFRGASSKAEGKKLLVNNALFGIAIVDGIKRQLKWCNMPGATRNTNDPRYSITRFKLTFRPDLVDFRRYSATGNRYVNFVIEKLRKLCGYSMWFPPPIYP